MKIHDKSTCVFAMFVACFSWASSEEEDPPAAASELGLGREELEAAVREMLRPMFPQTFPLH